ncbi:tRNA lysidine(34) synthetase TilS [Dyella sp. A6]|uniref:tRNA lysidine(34) synthetase TilS n=1 Tax=Dyella aluminiiresistens TaxID=3069105 RepID=UPI002E75C2B4|nr:tRNA lysidine(34) synthetase TilS [Dyella sp. A6]
MSTSLTAHLSSLLATTPAAALCVGFSGGADSTALLHALAQLPAARARGLRALHVDHCLHADSAAWADHCQRLCDELDVPCEVVRVHVETGHGEGLEAAARHARRTAFVASLRPDEWLLLAHHRDDQAETVLLKLLRGAGPEGLGGMRERRPFGANQLWRPLLPLSRAQLRAYVDAHGLDCIEDPSNSDRQLSRNYLRHEILPRLSAHWPQAIDSILHSANASRAAADALRDAWLAAFERLYRPDDGSLEMHGWLALPAALRHPLLDHWLHLRGRSTPTTAQRRQIERQCAAKAGQTPCIRWPGSELRIWKERLWALPALPPVEPDWQCDWHGEPLTLPDGGRLRLSGHGGRLPAPLQVRLRRGGERIRPAGDAFTRELRDLFQQAAWPPWQRHACPLLYEDELLIAVAGRWFSERGAALFKATGVRPVWQPGS